MGKLRKFLDEPSFIQWSLTGDSKAEERWQLYLEQHPDEAVKILELRSLLRGMRTRDVQLSEKDRESWFEDVLLQIEQNRKKIAWRSRIYVLSRYAAVAVLFFAIGALLFYRKAEVNPMFFSQNLREVVPGGAARLIRPDGSDIAVGEEKSKVEVISNGKLVVNDDTIRITSEDKENAPGKEISQLIIPYGKTSQMTLSDGTKVYLNAGSRFVFPEAFTGHKREVMLIGEAFFEVAHDPEHPFVVQTSDLQINVLGTRFNLSAYPADPEIVTTLAEGRVRIEKNNSTVFDEKIELVPMQMASFNRTTGISQVKKVDPESFSLWKDGILKFESLELNRIMKKLERYYNVRFFFRDPMTGTQRFSGKLDMLGDFSEILTRIERTARVKIIKINESMYEIKG